MKKLFAVLKAVARIFLEGAAEAGYAESGGRPK